MNMYLHANYAIHMYAGAWVFIPRGITSQYSGHPHPAPTQFQLQQSSGSSVGTTARGSLLLEEMSICVLTSQKPTNFQLQKRGGHLPEKWWTSGCCSSITCHCFSALPAARATAKKVLWQTGSIPVGLFQCPVPSPLPPGTSQGSCPTHPVTIMLLFMSKEADLLEVFYVTEQRKDHEILEAKQSIACHEYVQWLVHRLKFVQANNLGDNYRQ